MRSFIIGINFIGKMHRSQDFGAAIKNCIELTTSIKIGKYKKGLIILINSTVTFIVYGKIENKVVKMIIFLFQK